MSIKIMAEVWDHAEVGGSALVFLLALADQANDDDRCAWPGGKLLMQRVRCSRRSIYNHAELLQKQGIITALEPEERPERYSKRPGRETTCWRINPVSEWRGAEVAPLSEAAPQGGNELHPRGVEDCTRTTTTPQETPPISRRAVRRDIDRPVRASRKKRLVQDTDDDLERIGGGDDVEAPAPSNLRELKPRRATLSTTYLVEAFADRALEVTDVPVSARTTQKGALGRNIKKWVREGADPAVLMQIMDKFFSAAASYRYKDQPLWMSFVNRYPDLYEQATTSTVLDLDYYTKKAPVTQYADWQDYLDRGVPAL